MDEPPVGDRTGEGQPDPPTPGLPRGCRRAAVTEPVSPWYEPGSTRLTPPPPPRSCGSSQQARAGLQTLPQLLSSFPGKSHPRATEPLRSLCVMAQQGRPLAEPVPETSRSPQLPPAPPNFALPLPSTFIKSCQELPPPPSNFHQFALANGETRSSLGGFSCQNGS